jgi:hypothetical protein
MREPPTYDEMLYNEGYRDGRRGERLRAKQRKPYRRLQQVGIFFGGLIAFAIGYVLTVLVFSIERIN